MDFSLILFISLVVTGLISYGYRLMFEGSAGRTVEGVGAEEGVSAQRRQPVLVEYARALFPVILIVFVLRSFVVEPFRIPSGSMLPGLQNGDFILVNKFSYGIRSETGFHQAGCRASGRQTHLCEQETGHQWRTGGDGAGRRV